MPTVYPPLNALKAFATVVRVGSLTAAAKELNVSQSAITRQISVLEDYLGITLFQRHGRGVKTTPLAQTYADQICPLFESIASVTSQLTRSLQSGPLTVMAYTTFSAKWLLPRLGDFLGKHPGVEVELINSTTDVDFSRDTVDVAIQYGTGWEGVRSDLLIKDRTEPVCCPAFYDNVMAKSGGDVDALLSSRLIVAKHRQNDWEEWLTFAELSHKVSVPEIMYFDTYVLAWQATINGLGISIGYIPQLLADLEAGRLITPFKKPMLRDKGYYLVRPKIFDPHPYTVAFSDWLLEETMTLR